MLYQLGMSMCRRWTGSRRVRWSPGTICKIEDHFGRSGYLLLRAKFVKGWTRVVGPDRFVPRQDTWVGKRPFPPPRSSPAGQPTFTRFDGIGWVEENSLPDSDTAVCATRTNENSLAHHTAYGTTLLFVSGTLTFVSDVHFVGLAQATGGMSGVGSRQPGQMMWSRSAGRSRRISFSRYPELLVRMHFKVARYSESETSLCDSMLTTAIVVYLCPMLVVGSAIRIHNYPERAA
ncbi:hypothetical protein QBC37DRAFT_404257 [Rhypophila decipiens]|uniref:Uncharacterized protein n=1 Tax=Rhypophila decipiens TaxID=261697 RepID=A0AAN6XZ05_9PEZI|nr:hypothetical protein QBC37DRAFT_404257 [Rhypophila decipiens]